MIVITICILFDLLICLIVCSFSAKKNDKKSILLKTPEKENKNTKIKNLIKKIRHLFPLGSLLRLNLFIVSYIPSHTIRNFLYKNVFKVKMGKNVVIYYNVEIRSPWNLEIGDGSIIGDKAILDARNGLKIGKNVNFSTGVWVWTEQHGVNNEDFSCDGQGGSVIIEDRCWCGPRTIILPRKTLGEGSVLAAGAVLTKDAEPFSIYAGIPAQKIGKRNHNINYEFNGERFHML